MRASCAISSRAGRCSGRTSQATVSHELASYPVVWEGNNVVLLAAGRDEDDAVGFTTWDDSADNLENFTRGLLRARPRRDGAITTPVALLHRADNTYNRRAISVATPTSSRVATSRAGRSSRSQVADARSRHLGYLSDRFLREVGVETLPALAKLAGSRGGEVLCTAMVFNVADLMLDLPVERVLTAAIESFLAKHGVDAWQQPRQHTSPSEKTIRALDQIRTYDNGHAPVEILTLGTVVDEYGHRTITLADPHTLQHTGDVVDGHLVLDDERDRPQVLALLAQADIAVTQPADPVRPDPSGLCHRPGLRRRVAAGSRPKPSRPIRTRGMSASTPATPRTPGMRGSRPTTGPPGACGSRTSAWQAPQPPM